MASLRKARLLLLQTFLAAAFLGPGSASAVERVELELVLAVDCSSSVDNDEYTLQMHGIAAAFEDPKVLAALEQSGSIAVALLQWSSAGQQAEVIDWTHIDDAGDSLVFAERVRNTKRQIPGGATALSPAIALSVSWMQRNAYQGERVVIDISGDGRANEGGSPAFARAAANRAGVTINGLAILNEEPRLARYYLAGVVGGPGAFLLTADDFDDFALAMRRKLYFEIVGPPIAGLPATPPPHGAQVTHYRSRY